MRFASQEDSRHGRQRDIMEVLQISIDAAKRRNEQLGHILFDGPPV